MLNVNDGNPTNGSSVLRAVLGLGNTPDGVLPYVKDGVVSASEVARPNTVWETKTETVKGFTGPFTTYTQYNSDGKPILEITDYCSDGNGYLDSVHRMKYDEQGNRTVLTRDCLGDDFDAKTPDGVIDAHFEAVEHDSNGNILKEYFRSIDTPMEILRPSSSPIDGVHHYEYHENGEIKQDIKQSYDDGELYSITKYEYDTNGKFVEKHEIYDEWQGWSLE